MVVFEVRNASADYGYYGPRASVNAVQRDESTVNNYFLCPDIASSRATR
jgi:hypothetical protein